jgi:hypothetical protein
MNSQAQNCKIAEAFLLPVEYLLKQNRFHDAADSILLLVRAFELEEAILLFIKEMLEDLPVESQFKLMTELVKSIKWSAKISHAYFGKDHRQKIKSFTDLFSSYLNLKAQAYLKNKEFDRAIRFRDGYLGLIQEKGSVYSNTSDSKIKSDDSIYNDWHITSIDSIKNRKKTET